MAQQANNNLPNELFPARTIARPIKNLGNTCYMNAVLQALAHAPELCLAMDCEPHHTTCPIAAENYARQKDLSGEPSPSSSPDNTSNNNNINNNGAAPRKAGTRKSLRSGRKSPQEVEETRLRRLQFCALCEVEQHVKKVHDSSLKDQPVAPSTFVDGFIDFVAPWFKPGLQEDSHEFLRLLIDAMQKSCEKARSQDNPQDDSPTSASSGTAQGDKDSEYPFSLFRGTVESNVTCESCKASSSTLDPIEDIGLEVTMPTSGHNTTSLRLTSDRSSRNNSPTPAPALADVQTAFQRFARAEPLDGYKCETCGLVGRATKQSRLASIPPILTLHLKRFRYGDAAAAAPVVRRTGRSSEVGQLLGSHTDFKSGSAKIEGNIKFDELFDLKPYLTDELQAKHKNMLCRLFAVIVHAGKNSHSGHYIAYVRSLSKCKNEWWKMDDGRVTLASPQEVLRSEAYMLFYRVVQHPVASRLEQEYKDKVAALSKEHIRDADELETAESLMTETMTEAASAVAAASMTLSRPSRKRSAPPTFENGEQWARAKTKFPPAIYGFLKKVGDKIAEDAALTKEFVQVLMEEAAKKDARVGQGPKDNSVYVDDVEDGAKAVRLQLRDFFKGVGELFEKEDSMNSLLSYLSSHTTTPEANDDVSTITTTATGITTTTTGTTSKITTSTIISTATSTGTDEKRVAVVEPEEEMALL